MEGLTTPGPWIVGRLLPRSVQLTVFGPEIRPQLRPSIARVLCPTDYGTYDYGTYHKDSMLANALLIAAAPELLAACRKALAGVMDPDARAIAKAAVAKAEGK